MRKRVHQAGQERHHLRVEAIASKCGVDRISVHARERPRRAKRGRANVPVLREIFAVRSAAHGRIGKLMDGFRKPPAPGVCIGQGRRRSQIGKFIPEIPTSERRMACETLGNSAAEQLLGRQQGRIAVDVGDTIGSLFPIRNRAEAPARGRSIERPFGQPIDAAHVAAKKRRHSLEPMASEHVHDVHAPIEGLTVHRRRRRLKELP